MTREPTSMESMNFTDDQTSIRDAARKFAQERVKPQARLMDEVGEPPRKMFEEMGRLGFMGMLVPETFDGIGADSLSLVLALEETSRASAAMGTLLLAHNLFGEVIHRYGQGEGKQAWLATLVEGNLFAALALNEPNLGTDLRQTQTTADPTPEGHYLSGKKLLVGGGRLADVLLVSARIRVENLAGDRAAGNETLGLFLVPRDSPGMTIRPQPSMGLRGAAFGEVVLDRCLVPATHGVGRPGQGLEILEQMHDLARIGAAAQALGIAAAAIEEATTYAQSRRQFNQEIIRFEAIAFMLAEMLTDMEAARQLMYQVARQRDQGRNVHVAAAEARLFATTMVNRVTNQAVQIHGGYGYVREAPVERYFRDARVLMLYDELPETQKKIIAAPLLAQLDG